MKWLIPSGLPDKDEWGCVKLDWPVTTEWRAVLAGALYLVARGRSWDEKSGTVTQARDWGIELFSHNFPFTVCTGDEGSGSPSTGENCPTCGGGLIVLEGDGDMGQVVTDVTVNEDGQIVVWFGPCCPKTLSLTLDAIQQTGQTPESNLPPAYNPETTQADVACQKAGIIVHHLVTMASIIAKCNIGEGSPDPLNYVHNLDVAYPSVSFDWWDITIALVINGWDSFQGDSVEDTTPAKLYRCALSKNLDGSTWEVTKDDFSAMKNTLGTAYDLDTDAVLHSIIDGVGRGDWSDLVKRDAPLATTYDCGCPELQVVYNPLTDVPADSEWLYDFDFTTSTNEFTVGGDSTWTDGLGIWSDFLAGNDMKAAQAVIARRVTQANLDNTLVKYAVVMSSEWPTGGYQIHYGDVLAFVKSGVTSKLTDVGFPPKYAYANTWPSGKGWGANSNMTLFSSFWVQGDGEPPTGQHVITRLVIAGTGEEPLTGLPNLLAE